MRHQVRPFIKHELLRLKARRLAKPDTRHDGVKSVIVVLSPHYCASFGQKDTHIKNLVLSGVQLSVKTLEVAQVLGEPHRDGRVHLLGPVDRLRQLFGFARL